MTQENKSHNYFQVAPEVWGITDILVNVYLVRNPTDGKWVIIDTGLKTAESKIKQLARELFGPHARPEAIFLTHGHFDHIGSLKELARDWDTPIYAHHLEFPYLTGKSDYPPPDPTVNGGLMAKLSWMFPKKPINVEEMLNRYSEDGSLPFLTDWKLIFTPGHSPGHVSFFREKDRLLISGDAIITTQQESAFYVLFQKKKLSGPPKYFTCDWKAAKNSAERLTALNPLIIASGHGKPMGGAELKGNLEILISHFDEQAVPKRGRYVDDPAVTDDKGIIYLPPETDNKVSVIVVIILLIIVLTALSFFS